MDFREVNRTFAQDTINLVPSLRKSRVLDAGCGTARISILIAKERPQWQITAIDLAQSMLDVAAQNIQEAELQRQISLNKVDAKKMPYPEGSFDLVISNSLLHHLPNPISFLQELKRVLKADGAIIIRDLLSPPTEAAVDAMVSTIGDDYNNHQKKLFRDSLRAAFTLEEKVAQHELLKHGQVMSGLIVHKAAQIFPIP